MTKVKVNVTTSSLHRAMKDGVITRTSDFDKGIYMHYGTTYYQYFYNGVRFFKLEVDQGWGFPADVFEIEVCPELAITMIEGSYVYCMTDTERHNRLYQANAYLNTTTK